MFLDLNSFSSDQRLDFDLCIIGAGAAGITIAREFLKKDFQVCVLESGGLNLEEKTQALKGGETIGPLLAAADQRKDGKAEPYTVQTRLRIFGGSTQHWAGYSIPLQENDFLERPWIPHSGWPFRREALMEFYPKAAEICQLVVPEVLNQKPKLKYPPINFGSEGNLETKFIHFSPPTQFGIHYRKDFEAAQNIQVILHANVTNIELNKSGKSVERLEVRSLDGKKIFVHAKKFVLATGGLENARLLLASNSQHSKGVGNEHDLVGRFFMEHLEITLGQFLLWKPREDLRLYERHTEPDLLPSHLPAEGRELMGVLFPSKNLLEKEKILSFSAQIWFAQKESPDVDPIKKTSFELDTQPFSNFFKSSKQISSGSFYIRTEQAPNPANRVSLSSKKDAFGKPLTKLIWNLFPNDLDVLTRSISILGREFGKTSLGRTKLEGLEQIKSGIEGQAHHLGTTRMHRDPKQGVVNENGRVHSLSNLYVAGSSVFPTGSCVNPTFNIVALSLRLSKYLQQTPWNENL